MSAATVHTHPQRHCVWPHWCVPAAAMLALAVQQGSYAAEQAVALAASSTSLDRAPIVFTARYAAPAWTGTVTAQQTQANRSPVPLWDAAQALDRRTDADLASQRVVLSIGPADEAASFQWSAMTLAHRAALSAQGLDETRVDYLRGDLRHAAGGAAGGTLRPRTSRLGDIVNSNLWYVGARPASASGLPARPAMVYTGANDGMLHGFAAEDGTEMLAYVPRGVLGRLSLLANANYAHQYYVDGPVFAGDALVTDEARRTFVVAALGAGGKGFFVLDVTDPTQFSAAQAARIVHVDRTGTTDRDIGQISAPPVVDAAAPNRSRQIVRMNNGRWAVVMGNGHFSADASPVLLIQYLDDRNRDRVTGARQLQKISPCAGVDKCVHRGGNGLAAPQLIDLNGDGRVDVAYAGDLHGNVWKFDLSANDDGADPANAWRVAFDNRPFFITRAADGTRQAITSAPHWMPHPRGGIMLAVGTGRNLDDQDRSSKQIDTVYGLYDDSVIVLDRRAVAIKDTTPIHTADDAQPRSSGLTVQSFTDTVQDAGTTYRTSTGHPVDYAGPVRKRGWLLDLPTPGERVLHNPRTLEGQRFVVQTTVPTTRDTAQADAEVVPRTGGASTLLVLNMLTGQPPAQQVFALPHASLAADGVSAVAMPAGLHLQWRQTGQTRLQTPGQPDLVLRGNVPAGLRTGWREVR